MEIFFHFLLSLTESVMIPFYSTHYIILRKELYEQKIIYALFR